MADEDSCNNVIIAQALAMSTERLGEQGGLGSCCRAQHWAGDSQIQLCCPEQVMIPFQGKISGATQQLHFSKEWSSITYILFLSLFFFP